MKKGKKIFFIIGGIVFTIITVAFTYRFIDVFKDYVILENNNLGEGFYYDEEQECIKGEIIPSFIEDYNANGDFIIAKQNPRGDMPRNNKSEYDYPWGVNANYYWVIDKLNKQYYGPLDSLGFKNVCDSLKITQKLSSEILPIID